MSTRRINLIKMGGQLLDEPDLRRECLEAFARMEGPKILVHGGGRRASTLARETGVEVRMVEGRRITDDATLEIALMVYAGLLNKGLVAELQALGCPALGLSGADGDLIRARKRPAEPIDFGWVGDVDRVNTGMLDKLLESGWCPVVCALTHDGNGQLLNTNADTIAMELSSAMAAVHELRLWFSFERDGVYSDLNRPDSLLMELDRTAFERMRSEGSIAAGMVPKLENAFKALDAGVQVIGIGKGGYFAENHRNYTRILP